MSVCIYHGGYDTVRKSGVGKALEHQTAALKSAGLPWWTSCRLRALRPGNAWSI